MERLADEQCEKLRRKSWCRSWVDGPDRHSRPGRPNPLPARSPEPTNATAAQSHSRPDRLNTLPPRPPPPWPPSPLTPRSPEPAHATAA
ncbi:hypothetical protein CLV70_105123 [Pseudosporangium ferrugineum]|uniref:Uncharacterized protein n=1 Tax=Pseudosporangium ferrugineum TaxID=439699 RepID=A0A2T0S950_9ACTN|nr:hypothetical protein CLV70_105123 [Pseudosporangium ferrugineum]